jgi:hypothetical protein
MAGQPRTFETEEEIATLWDKYKLSVDTNPDKQEVATAKGVQVISVKKPYTRQGFEAFVYKATGKQIHQYIDNDGGNYEEYLGIVTHMRNEWQDDQISGTLTGRYKAPNLVARINGITEKVQTQSNINIKQFPDWLTKPVSDAQDIQA